MIRALTALVLSLPLIGAYGIFGTGIVLIYRTSRMLNLAHGAMAMVPAYALYSLVGAGVPVVAALPTALVVGAALGVAVEKLFVARLRSEGSTAQTVGTVAVLGVLIALVARLYGTASVEAVAVFPRGHVAVGNSVVSYGELGLFATMLVLAGALFMLIQWTDLGLMMRGSAENRLAASLMGVNPDRISSFTWALGGATAALAGILLAAVTTLDPYSLPLQVLPAFIAALIGGLGSLPGALVGAAIVGTVQGFIPLLGSLGELQGAPQLFLAILAIVVMAMRGRTLVVASDDERSRAATSATRASAVEREPGTPDQQRRATAARVVLGGLGVVAVVAFPFSGVSTSIIGSANLAAIYALVAVSVVLLTGWVGQISLGHAALVGIGSFVTGHVVALDVPFPFSLPLAAAITGAAAALLGAVAVRVRGLYLAVATLVFSWMASEFLFRQRWFISNSQISARPIGKRGELPYFDFTDRRIFYLVAWATLGAVVFAAANMRRTKTGRAFFAIRGSEMAAASLGIDVVRYKLIAFATSGFIAGAAGNLIMTDARVVSADQFRFTISLFYVAVAVVGGLTSLPGAVASGLLFAGLSEFFFQVPSLGAYFELVSAALLALTLLVGRGGLAAIPVRLRPVRMWVLHHMGALVHAVWARLRSTAEETDETEEIAVEELEKTDGGPRPTSPQAWWKRMLTLRLRDSGRGAESETDRAAPLDFREALAELVGSQVDRPETPGAHVQQDGDAVDDTRAALAAARTRIAEFRPSGPREERELLIEARNVTVRFGGLVAVNNACLEVRQGEIVGLIGPNGAGKTTLFNAIAGYNRPTEGSVAMYGQDVTSWPVHRRAQLGVARTFQLIQLFSELTVHENLLVATHVHNTAGVLSNVAVTGRTLEQERAALERVDQVIELLDLTDIAQQRAGDLPFGVLRMVEVARALVTGFRLIMLDEPASGLDNTETDRLTDVLRFVRGLGVTLLLIEHDVRMVTNVSDYMYVLDRGQLIAEGPPDEIQRNPEVIAAYLGEPTDSATAERASELEEVMA